MRADVEKFMDPYCAVILMILKAEGELRFNELSNKLEQVDKPLKNSMLTRHLKHLVDRKIVDKKTKNDQNVTYKIKPGKMDDLEEFTGFVRYTASELNGYSRYVAGKRGEFNPEKELFSSLLIGRQVRTALQMAMEIWLVELKLRISYRIFQKESDMLNLIALQNDYFKREEEWLIENCRASDENKTDAFNEIDKVIDVMYSPEEKSKN